MHLFFSGGGFTSLQREVPILPKLFNQILIKFSQFSFFDNKLGSFINTIFADFSAGLDKYRKLDIFNRDKSEIWFTLFQVSVRFLHILTWSSISSSGIRSWQPSHVHFGVWQAFIWLSKGLFLRFWNFLKRSLHFPIFLLWRKWPFQTYHAHFSWILHALGGMGDATLSLDSSHIKTYPISIW